MFISFLGLIAYVASAQAPASLQKYDCRYFGQAAFDHDAKLIEEASSCSGAAEVLHQCQWGSSADVDLASIVIKKCEATFAGKLAPAASKNYNHERHLCEYEYAGQEGTISISEEWVCAADVATDFSANAANYNRPMRRASFECARARTRLEDAICSNQSLGDADIVLNRTYKMVLNSLASSKRPVLVQQQKAWLKTAEDGCGISDKPLSKAAEACIRKRYEERFQYFDSCSIAGAEECLGDSPQD